MSNFLLQYNAVHDTTILTAWEQAYIIYIGKPEL